MMAKSLPEHSVIDMEEAQDIRSLREARGLTLDDVFKATRISLKNLEAIEEGAFYLLPPPIYTRAYFKSYARLLGVDESLITGAYERSLTVSTRVEENIEDIQEGESFFSKKFIINVVVILVLFVAGFLSYIHLSSPIANIAPDSSLTVNSIGKPVNAVTDAATSNKPAGEILLEAGSGAVGPSTQAVGGTTEGKNEGTTAAALTLPGEKPVLIIVAKEKTWLRIAEDQKDAYELLMVPGERIERSALQYTIDVGNAGGISVQFRGNSMNALGKSGEVVHLRLP